MKHLENNKVSVRTPENLMWLKPPKAKTMKCFYCGGTFEYTRSEYDGHIRCKCRDCGIRIIS